MPRQKWFHETNPVYVRIVTSKIKIAIIIAFFFGVFYVKIKQNRLIQVFLALENKAVKIDWK